MVAGEDDDGVVFDTKPPQRAQDAAEVADGADCLVLMVVNAAQAASVLFEAGALAFGGVDLVVNNAGLFAMQTLMKAPDLSTARAEMETNYFGPLSMCRAFAPILANPGAGQRGMIG